MAVKKVSNKLKEKKESKSSKRLVRSTSDKFLTGVIGGISEYTGVDSTILRLCYIAIVAFTGFVPGVVAYAVASVVIPEK